MAPAVILLAGAPSPSSVDDTSCTISRFQNSFSTLLGNLNSPSQDNEENTKNTISCNNAIHPTWRSLPLTRNPLHTGFSQAHEFDDLAANTSHDFFTTATISNVDGTTTAIVESQDLLTQFCEQSLAAHDAASSSQPEADGMDQSASSLNETSFLTTSSKSSRAPPPIPCHLSDVEDVPSARLVLELDPQKITVNIIVGIISIAQPRTVTTRWGRTLSLIEVLVGDETKSGFGITFWLSSDSISQSQLSLLRRQDVVLVQNVGLNVFRNQVYGQSLRRGRTRISLLWRRDGAGHYSTRSLAKPSPTAHPQLRKTTMVKDWVVNFVGGERSLIQTKRPSRKSWDQPPDDTQ